MTSRRSLVRLTAASASAMAILVSGCGSGSDQPAGSAKASTVTAAPRASASTMATVPECPAGYAGLDLFTATSVWTLLPDMCRTDGVLAESFSLIETDVVSNTAVATRTVATADLLTAAPDLQGGTGGGLAPPSPAWGNLIPVGVVGRSVILRTERYLISVDADGGAIRAVDLASHDRSGGTVPAYLGVVDGSVLAIQGDVVARVDVEGGTVELLGTTGVSGSVTFGPDAAWVWTVPQPNVEPPPTTADPSEVVRIDGEGSVHRLVRFDGSILPGVGGPYPGPGLLWALTVDPGVDWWGVISGTDAQHQLRVVGVDRDDGHAVASIDAPPEPGGSFLPFAFRDGFLAITGYGSRTSWRWIDNGGNVTTLTTPPDFTPIGVAGDRLVGRTPENLITSIGVSDLIAPG